MKAGGFDIVFLFFILINFISVGCFLLFKPVHKAEEPEDTVVLSHVLFRHGNRTPDLEESYPKDPYYNFTYFPFGRGQLTNVGKQREFYIGKTLRERYNKFLGEYYYPEILDAFSTDYNRTKSSLLLVLAGLFPPKKVEVWNSGLNWQPVPYNYRSVDNDPILIGSNCPRYSKIYNEQMTSDKWQSIFREYQEIFDYISTHTGLNVKTFREVAALYFGLSTEEEWGFKLPDWTKKVWPKIITDIAVRNYFANTATTELIKYLSGFNLKKIIEDSKNLNKPSGRKLYLYSAHETNVAHMLILLNLFDPPHVPTYGSYLIFEVHKIDGQVGFKIFYQNYSTDTIQHLKVPSCGYFCPIEEFEKIYEEYLPDSEDFCYNK